MTEGTPAFEQQRAMCEVSEPFDFGTRKNSGPDIELRRVATADDGSHPCCRSDHEAWAFGVAGVRRSFESHRAAHECLDPFERGTIETTNGFW
jgi:hypothetical protein